MGADLDYYSRCPAGCRKEIHTGPHWLWVDTHSFSESVRQLRRFVEDCEQGNSEDGVLALEALARSEVCRSRMVQDAAGINRVDAWTFHHLPWRMALIKEWSELAARFRVWYEAKFGPAAPVFAECRMGESVNHPTPPAPSASGQIPNDIV